MSRPVQLQIESSQGDQAIPVAPAQLALRLTELLRQKHLPLNTRCGQRGLCDGCIVELLEGQLVRLGSGDLLESSGQPVSVRGCEYRLGDCDRVRIHIPPRSLLAYEPQVVSNFKINIPHAHDPLWQQIEIPAGELNHAGSIADQLCRAIARRTKRRRPVRIDPRVAPARPAQNNSLYVTTEYREDHWLITAVAANPGAAALGAAIDIGTTTVAVLLVDLASGQIVGQAANFNKQMHLGDDVLTRINLCSTDPTMTGHLQQLIVNETIAPLLAEALQKTGAAAGQIRCVTVAGNSTMLHLFAGVDPSPMGIAPFTPVFLEHRVLQARAVHLELAPPAPSTEPARTRVAAPFTGAPVTPTDTGVEQSPVASPDPTVHLLPGAAAYVGADLTAGAFATGLVYDDGPNLLVDVGTNGEIILKRGDHLYGCATAAGPAFEGAGLTHGVRAADGAIAHVQLTAHPFTVKTELIGKQTPVGLCGTAYIDFLAEARQIGLLTRTGRIDPAAVAGGEDRLVSGGDYGLAVRIAYAQGKREIVVSETDVARLLQAKAAVAAGILTLLERIGLKVAEVKTLYLAGGFGLHLNADHAIGCGLLPGFKREQIQVVGNTSLGGAYLALLDCGALDEIARAGKKMEVIELNLDPGFEERYIDQLSLPE